MTRPRILAARADRPVTLPACPNCGELLRPKRFSVSRGRDAIHFLACRCGHQQGHTVEREAIPA
jgi:ribosomal protein L32